MRNFIQIMYVKSMIGIPNVNSHYTVKPDKMELQGTGENFNFR